MTVWQVDRVLCGCYRLIRLLSGLMVGLCGVWFGCCGGVGMPMEAAIEVFCVVVGVCLLAGRVGSRLVCGNRTGVTYYPTGFNPLAYCGPSTTTSRRSRGRTRIGV